MVRIIFKDGRIVDCENVEKIYIENDNISLETKHIRDIIADVKEFVGEKLGVKAYTSTKLDEKFDNLKGTDK